MMKPPAKKTNKAKATKATKRANPESGARKYTRLHWGLAGNGRTSATTAPDPKAAPLVLLGDLVSVVYRTAKGADGLSEYEHEFGATMPKLLVNREGGLIIAGGRYTVTTRGIEG